MAKILFLVALAVIVYLLLRARRLGRSDRVGSPDAPKRPAEAIVACSRCGVHVPASESFMRDGRHYCSDEHRRLG